MVMKFFLNIIYSKVPHLSKGKSGFKPKIYAISGNCQKVVSEVVSIFCFRSFIPSEICGYTTYLVVDSNQIVWHWAGWHVAWGLRLLWSRSGSQWPQRFQPHHHPPPSMLPCLVQLVLLLICPRFGIKLISAFLPAAQRLSLTMV